MLLIFFFKKGKEHNSVILHHGLHTTYKPGCSLKIKKSNFSFRLNVPNCTEITLPVEDSTDRVKESLHEKIINKEYFIGELIIPLEFTKLALKDNKLFTETIKIQGRKIPLYDIRKSSLTKERPYMRESKNDLYSSMSKEEIINHLAIMGEVKESYLKLDQDELLSLLKSFENTRNLMLWHDGSTISNHGHLLMTVATMYDKAIHLTDAEYFEKYGRSINVQSVIEKPNVYILARCPSTDQQMSYSNERLQDILKTQHPIKINDQIIYDKIRIFKGDKPASQFEMGHQKGGNYYCFACPINSHCSSSMVYSYKLEHLSIQKRIDKIMVTTGSKERLSPSNLKLYNNLSKADIINELHQRDVKFLSTSPTKELQELLNYEMGGIQRMPALIHHYPFKSLKDLQLENYEILYNEPLHDVSNHVKNIFEEFPLQIPGKKKLISDIITTSFNGKDAKKSADYRKSLVIVTLWAIENIPEHYFVDILKTLCEIQEILYLPEEKRTMTTILRLLNVTHVHATTIRIHLTKLRTLTSRKFYGAYYHAIIRHASDQYRIVSGRASNTEKEEALFQKLKKFATATSNHHPDNVISNSIVRLQAREIIQKNENKAKKTDSFVHKLYQPLKTSLANTVIPFSWIENHPNDHQVLLKRQADFLSEGTLWWNEIENVGIEFLDVTGCKNTKLTKHHFRSWNITEEITYLKNAWEICLANMDELIPAYKLKIFDLTTKATKIIYLKTIRHFDRKRANDDEIPVEVIDPISTSVTDLNKINNVTPIIDFTTDTIDLTPTKQTEQLTIAKIPTERKNDTCSFSTSTPLNIKTCNPVVEEEKDEEEEQIISLTPITIPLKNEDSCKLSNTSLLVKQIIGDNEIVNKFDDKRKALKKLKSKENIESYEKCLAELEVIIVLSEEKLKDQLKEIEMKELQSSKSLNVIPKENSYKKEEYLEKIKKLKCIKRLKLELKF